MQLSSAYVSNSDWLTVMHMYTYCWLQPASRTQVSDLVSSVRTLYNEANLFVQEKVQSCVSIWLLSVLSQASLSTRLRHGMALCIDVYAFNPAAVALA